MTVAYNSCLDGLSAELVVTQRVVGIWEGCLKLDRALLLPFPLLGRTKTHREYTPISPSSLHCSSVRTASMLVYYTAGKCRVVTRRRLVDMDANALAAHTRYHHSVPPGNVNLTPACKCHLDSAVISRHSERLSLTF